MTLYLHNTLTGDKEAFQPIDPERVTLYVCGPTVYNYVHIGNARPVVVFDVLYRLLQRLYPNVVYARNITDIDDKIIHAAREHDEPMDALTARFTDAFHEDMGALNAHAPTVEPRATEHVDDMIAIIETLLDTGHAYESEGHVLFAVESMPGYGRLSGQSPEELRAGARVEVADYKRHPGDFVLWKPSEENQPGWDSPWGRGRPGWHIECSAMVRHHLGAEIDIHGGGRDLIFPHHENEIAQGCCAHGGDYVRYWMHNGYINIEGEKMSKSLGNFHLVHELLRTYDGEVLRFALLSAQYRSPLNFSQALLEQARNTLNSFYHALRDHADTSADPDYTLPDDHPVLNALLDDLNTAEAMAALHQVAERLNKAHADDAPRIKAELQSAAALLGLLEREPEAWFKRGPDAGPSEEEIEALITERSQAKKERDFTRADEIRDQLHAQGIVLEDTRSGTRWSRA